MGAPEASSTSGNADVSQSARKDLAGHQYGKVNHHAQQTWFGRVAQTTSHYAGRPLAFATALGIVLVWGISGPLFGFSDTWQLVINTGTTIVTFLMVFLIQNSQNRDTMAVHLKLDELLRALRSARNDIIDLEECDDAELERIRTEYRELADKAHSIKEDREDAAGRR